MSSSRTWPGAGSLTAVHYLDLNAPKDGTVFDTFNFGNIGESRLNPEKIKIDFRKYNWIGSISHDLTVCYVWHGLGVKTLAELKAFRPVHFGLTGTGTSSDTNQRILKIHLRDSDPAGRRLSRQRRAADRDRARRTRRRLRRLEQHPAGMD